MPEVDNECTFEVGVDQMEFHTKTNGDQLFIRGLHLTASQAASLAWLVNSGSDATLEVQIKIKDE